MYWADLKFSSNELKKHFLAIEGGVVPRTTKRKGHGTIDDNKALNEMDRMLKNSIAPSVRAAAEMCIGMTSGASDDAIIERLRKKYRSTL